MGGSSRYRMTSTDDNNSRERTVGASSFCYDDDDDIDSISDQYYSSIDLFDSNVPTITTRIKAEEKEYRSNDASIISNKSSEKKCCTLISAVANKENKKNQKNKKNKKNRLVWVRHGKNDATESPAFLILENKDDTTTATHDHVFVKVQWLSRIGKDAIEMVKKSRIRFDQNYSSTRRMTRRRQQQTSGISMKRETKAKTRSRIRTSPTTCKRKHQGFKASPSPTQINQQLPKRKIAAPVSSPKEIASAAMATAKKATGSLDLASIGPITAAERKSSGCSTVVMATSKKHPVNYISSATPMADFHSARNSKLVWIGKPDNHWHIEGGWPSGWTLKVYERTSGKAKGRMDRYWFSPCNHKFRSKTEVRTFLSGPTRCDQSSKSQRNTKKSHSNGTGEREIKAKSDDDDDDDVEEEPTLWDLKTIFTIDQINNKHTRKKCSRCSLVACSFWVAPSSESNWKWYCCIDCQQKDFLGWPPIDELPIKHMTKDHIQTLVKHCSHQKSPAMPCFENDSQEFFTLHVDTDIDNNKEDVNLGIHHNLFNFILDTHVNKQPTTTRKNSGIDDNKEDVNFDIHHSLINLDAHVDEQATTTRKKSGIDDNKEDVNFDIHQNLINLDAHVDKQPSRRIKKSGIDDNKEDVNLDIHHNLINLDAHVDEQQTTTRKNSDKAMKKVWFPPALSHLFVSDTIYNDDDNNNADTLERLEELRNVNDGLNSLSGSPANEADKSNKRSREICAVALSSPFILANSVTDDKENINKKRKNTYESDCYDQNKNHEYMNESNDKSDKKNEQGINYDDDDDNDDNDDCNNIRNIEQQKKVANPNSCLSSFFVGPRESSAHKFNKNIIRSHKVCAVTLSSASVTANATISNKANIDRNRKSTYDNGCYNDARYNEYRNKSGNKDAADISTNGEDDDNNKQQTKSTNKNINVFLKIDKSVCATLSKKCEATVTPSSYYHNDDGEQHKWKIRSINYFLENETKASKSAKSKNETFSNSSASSSHRQESFNIHSNTAAVSTENNHKDDTDSNARQYQIIEISSDDNSSDGECQAWV